MEFRGDRRGQSSLIGFILLFAILTIAFSSYQAVVVPSQNAEVEFTHSQQIENDFSQFRSNVVNAVESTDERSTSFTLGTQYPSRLMALNPPAPAGTLSTTEPGTVELDGATVSNVCGADAAGNTTSRSLVYEPQYNEYQGAQSTVYEHTFVGTTFRDGQSFPQSQRLLRDGRVNLQLLTGDIAESRTGSFGVEINASHRYTHDQNITSLTIPSQFDNETWETQILDDQGNIDNIENTSQGVRITFVDSVEVSCAVVGLDTDPEFTPPSGGDGSSGGSASGLQVVSDTTPTKESTTLEFDLRNAGSSDATITAFEVTTPGNQNSNVQSATQLKRGSGKEVRLTVSDTSGVNQSGGLNKNIELDGKKYALDTNAVFSNGAVLSVDMGEIENGGTEWTYKLADSQSNADAVVTFYFQDGTQFQVYLRVTSVNS